MKNKNSKLSLSGKLKRFVKEQDDFGIPVSLTFNKQPQIKSFFGGSVTIITRLLILAYLLYQTSLVISKQATIQYSVYQRDLTVDQTESVFTQSDFDFGYNLEYINLETESAAFQSSFNIYQYAQPVLYQYIKGWGTVNGKAKQITTKYDLQTKICGSGRLGTDDADSVDYLGIQQSYQCPVNINFSLKGNQASPEYRYIQLSINPCNQTFLTLNYPGQKCAPTSDQLRIQSYLKLYVVIQNSYFDTKDFSSNPIKKFLRPHFLFMTNGTSHHLNLVMGKHQVLLNDNMVYGPAVEMSYVESKFHYTSSGTTPDNSGIMLLNIFIDDTVKVTERQVFTFFMAVSASGGFLSAVLVIARLFASKFQIQIYFTSLIKSFYKHQVSLFNQPIKKNNKNNERNDSQVPNSSKEFSIQTLWESDINEDRYKLVMDQINNRKKFIFGLKDLFMIFLKRKLCRNKRINMNDYELYQKGVSKIEKELDIRYLNNSLRTLKFISKIMLTKHQRQMIPYFNSNLLNKGKKLKNGGDNELQQNLKILVDKAEYSKIDKRILKNIVIEDQAIESKQKNQLKKKTVVRLNNSQKIPSSQINSARRHKRFKLNLI